VAQTGAEPPLADPDPRTLTGRASRGVALLLVRYGVVQLVGLAANIALSRLLSPASFGIYAITLGILVLLSWISDFGLGAALLQRRESMTDRSLGTVFLVQQGVLCVLVVAAFVAAGPLAAAYRLGHDGEWFVRAMALGGLLSSLKTVPNVVMERKLLYGRLSAVEIVEVLLFQLTAVVLAASGLGTWSFLVAILVSKAVGLLVTLWLARWRPRFALDRQALAGLLSFAVPFQAIWLSNLARDYMIPLLGGLLVGATEVGYLNWALALTSVPAQMAQVVGRVAFPSFARMQGDAGQLGRAIEQSTRALFLVAVPAELVLIALGPWLIQYVFSPKWMPALVPLVLLGLNWAGASITSPLFSAMNAIGRVRSAMVVGVVWTAATLLLAWALSVPFGYVGIAMSMLVTRVFASAVLIVLVHRAVPLRLWELLHLPVAAGTAVAVAGALAVHVLPGGLVQLLVLGAAMGLAYVAVMWVVEGARLRSEFTVLVARLRAGRTAE
jgi:O-antigen/teichoic acid export membrane protein